ncbi:MAG: Gfo/Idh/MocA family oxidoreductase [Betaproteobacteria bacterium]|nr:Gfo/Idh/MocA family oxidoreductase [Betaproteobacteria bacterium]
MLRAAICGAGHWGTRLIESVQGKSGKIRFVAALTRDPAARKPLGERFGLALIARYADVLADPAIDAVVLATPHSRHAAEIAAAAQAGKHVFVEKPFTLTRASAESAIESCRTAGITLHVGFNRRYAPAYADMKRRIAAGEIGALRHVEGNFSGPSSYQIEPGNWRSNQIESPGGSMTARGCHVLDAMVHVAGLATEVVAISERQQLDIDVDDTTSCLLRFAGGATGTLATLHAATRFYRMHAFGSKGALELRGDTELDVFDLDGNVRRLSFEGIDKERAELEAFADAVAGRVKFVIAPEEIVNVVAGTEAVVASARSGKTVTIS